jgi:hypothetical protein
MREHIIENIHLTARHEGRLYPRMQVAQRCTLHLVAQGVTDKVVHAAPYLSICRLVAEQEHRAYDFPLPTDAELMEAAWRLAEYVTMAPEDFFHLLTEQ